MLVVKLSSGLGNQLFMLALFRYLEMYTEERIVFDTTAFATDISNRRPEINILYPDFPVSGYIPWSPIGKKGLQRKINEQLFPLLSGFKMLNDNDELLIAEKPQVLTGNIYFNGYWQNSVFIEKLSNKNEFLSPKEKCPPSVATYLDCIRDHPVSVSIHIRRGDFYSNQYKGRYAVCNKNYYDTAVEEMVRKFGKISLFVFSDDLEWAKQNLSIPPEVLVTFIENSNINSYWYIWLMSHCHHNIISNSTFSWWGAYLNNYEEKEIMCPDKWQLDSNFHLALPSWTKIKVSI